jgi:hypothetical protein
VLRIECRREAEVLDALRSGAWPDGALVDLREHVDGCASCASLAGLVPALKEDCRTSTQDAVVPSSAVMWWRLQLRARREAEARVMRPIAAAQKLALACAAGLLAATFGAFAPAARHLAAWLGFLRDSAVAAGTAPSTPALVQIAGPFGLALAMTGVLVFVVAPVAIYLALSDR